jgi:hypothetical protein
MVARSQLIDTLYVHCLFVFHRLHTKIRIENSNIQGVFKKNACTDVMNEFSTSKQFLSMYVHKHLVFEGQPPLSPNLSPVDFYLYGYPNR